MSVKEHYDNHLSYFYSWMLGDFEERKNDFLNFSKEYELLPFSSKSAIDLGAGNGIQSIALAELGFKVQAVDFNAHLLSELNSRKNGLPIEVVNGDIKEILKYKGVEPELIVCCGDTISHLDSLAEIKQLIRDIYTTLTKEGKALLTFRDYSNELFNTSRFIPVKSDSKRILTCFLEYFPNKVRVTDIFHEQKNGSWQQQISSYEKVRISDEIIQNILLETGFEIILNKPFNRLYIAHQLMLLFSL